MDKKYDLICVGGGIMSATMALLAKLLKPDMKIAIFERLNAVAQESSAAWNNAGTGHSGLCEVNYTPEMEDGSINLNKAIETCREFEISRQFWSYLTETGRIKDPTMFIHNVPHHTWVYGKDNLEFLRKRYQAMKEHYMFRDMKFATELEEMSKWFPLIAGNRSEDEEMAATRMERGAEVNFGELTRHYFNILKEEFNTEVILNQHVVDIDPDTDLDWTLKARDLDTGKHFHYEADHIFIGAGGGALLLLEKVEIENKDGYGGFPVSGEWLVCKNEEVIKQHEAKVYSKAGPSAPPMSTPHLDTRHINGKKELLFGPFAGFSPKFLKKGSYTDLFKSINFENIPALWGAFWHNLPLTRYLLEQVSMSHNDRMEDLRKFVKNARSEDWELLLAGQRVQIIKEDEEEGGTLEFGTEVVSSKDGTITALLGASPGASTAVYIMLEALHDAFPEIMDSEEGTRKLDEIIPAWNEDLRSNEELFLKSLKRTGQALGLG